MWAKGESPSAGPSAQVKETQKMIGWSLVRRILVSSPLIGLQQIIILWDSGTQIIPDRSSQPQVIVSPGAYWHTCLEIFGHNLGGRGPAFGGRDPRMLLHILQFSEWPLSAKNYPKKNVGTSLAVQWLGLRTSTAGGTGSITGWGTKIPQAVGCDEKNKIRKKKKEKEKCRSCWG